MYQKRFLVGEIEHFYPGGLMYDAIAVTDSEHKAIELVLQRLMIVQRIKNFTKEKGLHLANIDINYVVFDFNTGNHYTFEYDIGGALKKRLNKLVQKYQVHEDFVEINKRLQEDYQKLSKSSYYMPEIRLEDYEDIVLDIKLQEHETKDVLDNCATVTMLSKIEVL